MNGTRVMTLLVFLCVLALHFAWVTRSQAAGGWAAFAPEGGSAPWLSYVRSGGVWLGLSYAVAAAFAVFCLLHLYERRRRAAVAGLAGGLTGVALLYVVGCFLLGCCGSPMLAVYVGLFGSRFLGVAKPLVFSLTTLSVLVGYACVTRKGGDASGCCSLSQSEASIARRLQADSRDKQAPSWVTGWLETPVGRVPRVATSLQFADRLGSWKCRWGIGRMSYQVEPGLYAVGRPAPESPVLVTANYKMTFDRLRQELGGLDAWLLVLNTFGVNVWCAAGKGTFGTDEVVRRVEATGLARIVSHRTLILPQLGAPGIAGHRVREATGFRVVYGPVRARDIPAFLAAGSRATPEMRRVTFTLWERLAVVPMELVGGLRVSLAAVLAFVVLAGFGRGGYSLERVWSDGIAAAALYFLGYLAGTVVTPALLPWLPGRAFALKGASVGGVLALAYLLWEAKDLGSRAGALGVGAWLFLLPAASSFFAMNFTGASPYTSPSGVRREVRVALPAQASAAAVGLTLWMVSHLL